MQDKKRKKLEKVFHWIINLTKEIKLMFCVMKNLICHELFDNLKSFQVNNNAVLLDKNQEKENIRVPPTSCGYDKLMPPTIPESIPSHHYATPTIYKERDLMAEMEILYEFLTKGIDHEDVEYLRRSYETLLADDAQSYWLNDTHWVDHPATDVPPPKRRKKDDMRLHVTGCARTEGYYKVDLREKLKHKVSM